MSVASTTLEPFVWADPRVWLLAQVAKYPDGIYSAVARLGHLWARCTYLGTDVPDEVEIRACLGPGGVEHLIESTLGERLEDGTVRVRGAISEDGKERLGWFRDLRGGPVPSTPTGSTGSRGQRSAAGSSRASKAVRGPGGKFLRGGSAGEAARPAGDQRATSGTVSLDQRDRFAGPATSSETASAGGSDLDQGSDRKNSPARAGLAGEVAGPAEPAGDQRATSGPAADGSDGMEAARAIGIAAGQLWTELEAQRAQVAADLKCESRPLHPQDPGERDLRARLRESKTLEAGIANARHVVAMALIEARASGSAQFLTGALFGERPWRRALGMNAADAKRAGEMKRNPVVRSGPQRGAPEPEKPRRIETLKPI